MDRTRIDCPPPRRPFVGRERELGWLIERLRSSPVAAVVGMPGIGKTALALALAEQAPARLGLTPTFIRCQPGWAAGSLLEALEARFGSAGPLPATAGSSDDRAPSLDDRAAHLASVADRMARLLVIDALELVDPEDGRNVLRLLSGQLERGRLLVTSRRRIGTAADDTRGPFELTLAELPQSDALRLASLTGGCSSPAAVVARTGGHPLFVVLLARWGKLSAGTDLLGSVLDGISPVELDLLAALSVVRVPIDRGLVNELGGTQTALDRLDELFLACRAPDESWSVPPAVAELLRSRVGAARTKELHRRAGELFEHRLSSEPEAIVETTQEAFHHFLEAGEPERSLDVLERSASILDARWLSRELVLMARQLDAALAVRPTMLPIRVARAYRRLGQPREALNRLRPLESQSLAPGLQNELFAELGQAHADLTQHEEALSYFSRALDRATEMEDLPMQVRMKNRVATVFKDRGEFDKALELFAQIEENEPTPALEGEIAFALYNEAKISYLRGDLPEALDQVERACELFDGSGDRLGHAMARNVLGNIQRDLGNVEAARLVHAENLELFRSTGNRFGEAASLSNLGDVHRDQGRLVEALESYQQAEKLSAESGNLFGRAIHTTKIAEAHRAMGQYAQALAAVSLARELWEGVGNSSGVAWSLVAEGEIQRDRGMYREALSALERAQTLRESLKEWTGVAACLMTRSMILADSGELSQANSLVRQAVDRLANRTVPESAQGLTSQAYILMRQGDLGTARQLLEALITHGSNPVPVRERIRALGSLATVMLAEGQREQALVLVRQSLELSRAHGDRRGEQIALAQRAWIHVVEQDLEAAVTSFRESYAVAVQLGDARGQAQALVGLGEALLMAGDCRQAEATLQRALRMAEEAPFPRPLARAVLVLAEIALRESDIESAHSQALRGLALAREGALTVEEWFADALLEVMQRPVSDREPPSVESVLLSDHREVLERRLAYLSEMLAPEKSAPEPVTPSS